MDKPQKQSAEWGGKQDAEVYIQCDNTCIKLKIC